IEGIDNEKNSMLRKTNEMTDWMKPNVSTGFENRLRGVKAPLGGILSNGIQLTQSINQSKTNGNPYNDSEVKALLRQLVEKDANIYMNTEKVGSIMDGEQARRINIIGRRVALD